MAPAASWPLDFSQHLKLFVAVRNSRHSELNAFTVWRVHVFVVCLSEDASALDNLNLQVRTLNTTRMIGENAARLG